MLLDLTSVVKVHVLEPFPSLLHLVHITVIERFSNAFTANGKRQAEIFSLMKINEAFWV